MANSYQAVALVALFLGVLAASFTGSFEPPTYSHQCIDGLDNDGDLNAIDGGIDVEDDACFIYPYSDGNGENPTAQSERYQDIREYPSLFEYHRDYGGFIFVCEAYGTGLYDSNPSDKASSDTWLDSQGLPRVGCPP